MYRYTVQLSANKAVNIPAFYCEINESRLTFYGEGPEYEIVASFKEWEHFIKGEEVINGDKR